MDAQTLERLLTDKALGGLDTDAETLLDDYLAGHPTALELHERIERTVGEARCVLGEDAVDSPPPWPHEMIERYRAARLRWRSTLRVMSLAACVLLGIVLHAAWQAGQPGGMTPWSGQSLVERSAISPPSITAAQAREPGFWSLKRAQERAEQNRVESGQRVIWDSPFSAHRLGDAT